MYEKVRRCYVAVKDGEQGLGMRLNWELLEERESFK